MKQYTVTKEHTFIICDERDQQISNPATVAMIGAKIADAYVEEMWALFVNSRNVEIEKVLIVRGSQNAVSVKPSDILRPALIAGAVGFVLLHNHPSGSARPSPEDTIFTKRVAKAADLIGIPMLDHVICTLEETEYYSFKSAGIIK